MRKKFNKIYIEITNKCNLNCSFCPKTTRPAEFMSLELFDRITTQAQPLCEEITLHIMGEPLLHPQLKEFILLCETKHIKINITTNATLLEQNTDILLNKTVRRINLSIHGIKTNFNQENQKKYLKKIINFTKIAQDKREDMIITYRLCNINDGSNKSILKHIENEFDSTLQKNQGKNATTCKVIKTSKKIKNNAYIHFDMSFKWPDKKDPIRNTKGYCHGLATHIGVLCDGTIVPCCLDNNAQLALGNINQNTIEEILQSKRAIAMKKGFQERKLVEDLCQRCTFIKQFEKEQDRK
ncbi:MAG: radical SAM/SPASM domain-containing protein [Candidatus Nanoarchaeia archaeon]